MRAARRFLRIVLCSVCLLFSLFVPHPVAAQSTVAQKETGRAQVCSDENVHGLKPGEPQRAKIDFPPEMAFAQKSRVAVEIGAHSVRKISISWQEGADGVLAPESDVVLQHERDGRAFIEVSAIGFGNLQLEVAFVYDDCGAELQRGQIRVPAPRRNPDKFVLAWTNWRYVRKMGTAHLDFADSAALVLIPLAYYKAVDSPVPVPRDQVEFEVITRNHERSPIAFWDTTLGSVKSVGVGQALVKAAFGGKTAYACIDVTRDAAVMSGYFDCLGFVPSGVRVPSGEPEDAPSSSRQ
jgi:hypothetical protein